MELATEIKTIEKKHGYAKIAIEPLEQGFGHTLGNALRRVLLSSLTGAAITRIKVEGVAHEFSTSPGLKEDMVEFVLNLKGVNFALDPKKPVIVTISEQGPKKILAADIKCPTGVEIINKDFYLGTLADKRAKLNCEITVEYGQGYRLPPEDESVVGVIPIDANFSPVRRVNYKVESTRIGRVTDLDRLLFEIWTDRSVVPFEALKQAAAILTEEFENIKGNAEIVQFESDERKTKKTTPSHALEQRVYLEELGLPTRIVNSLRKGGIETVEDVEKIGEEGLSQIKNIGPKTVKLVLEKVGNYDK